MQQIINVLGLVLKSAPKIKYWAKVAIEVIDAVDRVKDWDTAPLNKTTK